MRLIHLTDPHLSALDGESIWALRGKRRLGFLSWVRNRRAIHRPEILNALVEAVAKEHPDVIAVTGDLVQLALPREIDEATRWLERLASIAQVVLVPGNHDVYRDDAQVKVYTDWAPFLRLPAPPNADFPTIQRIGDVSVIGLSSACPEPFWSAGGELGAAQLQRFEDALRDSRASLRCVLIHHPPLARQCAGRKALRDTAALERLLARYGVELVLHGHVHHNAEVLFNERTRVFATASASNIRPKGRASYRVFNFSSDVTHWRVSATLKSLARDDSHAQTIVDGEWVCAKSFVAIAS